MPNPRKKRTPAQIKELRDRSFQRFKKNLDRGTKKVGVSNRMALDIAIEEKAEAGLKSAKLKKGEEVVRRMKASPKIPEARKTELLSAARGRQGKMLAGRHKNRQFAAHVLGLVKQAAKKGGKNVSGLLKDFRLAAKNLKFNRILGAIEKGKLSGLQVPKVDPVDLQSKTASKKKAL